MKISRRTAHYIILVVIFGIVVVTGVIYVIERDNTLKVFFLDIGQGDSVYIRTPKGRDMLVDAGPGKIVLERLAEVMPWYDRNIDVVIATHPDADHIGGLPDIIKRYEIGLFLEPGIESKNKIDDEVEKNLLEKGVESINARRGMRVNFGDGVHFDILYPDKDVSNLKETNNASIVGQLKYGSTTVMFTGDAPILVENDLIDLDGDRLASDILKVGHHGSRTSSGKDFVNHVHPLYAIISAGKDNRYGHPHKEVMDLFNVLGIESLKTFEEGTVQFISNGFLFVRK